MDSIKSCELKSVIRLGAEAKIERSDPLSKVRQGISPWMSNWANEIEQLELNGSGFCAEFAKQIVRLSGMGRASKNLSQPIACPVTVVTGQAGNFTLIRVLVCELALDTSDLPRICALG